MKYGSLILEKKEYVLLKRVLNLTGYYKDRAVKSSIVKLSEELKTALIYDEENMPNDVIRFHSMVTITAENGWEKQFQLVMPTDSDIKSDKVSILAPMGSAVIGYAEGDTIIWEFPNGTKTLKVSKVVQENNFIDSRIIL